MPAEASERSAWRRSSYAEGSDEDEDGTSWACRELEELCSQQTVVYKVQVFTGRPVGSGTSSKVFVNVNGKC